jgi:hypothetical protein
MQLRTFSLFLPPSLIHMINSLALTAKSILSGINQKAA